MSAYVVTDKQISAILQGVYGATHAGFNVWSCMVDSDSYHFVMGADLSHQQEANLLMSENIRSVNHRYNDNEKLVGKVLLDRDAKPLPVLTVLKLIDNLEYQSCECDDWEQTEAYKLLCRYRKILIHKLPGYDETPWGL